MTLVSDSQLLRPSGSSGDRAALAELISRHLHLVYAAARRQVGDVHLAEDVTQAVFILLAKKVHSIRDESALSSWLFSATRYAASNARRMQARRKHHEQHAAFIAEEIRSAPSTIDDALVELLDDAIADLNDKDRVGVLMSYFQDKTYRQIGLALGSTEEAARKRVSRAVNRLREFFAERGLVAGVAAVEQCLADAGAAVAPVHLAGSTVNIISLSAANAAPARLIAKGVSQMWMVAKMKVAAGVAVALVAGGLVTAQVLPRSDVSSQSKPLYLSHSSGDALVGELPSGIRVRFIGMCDLQDGTWFDCRGEKIADPSGAFEEAHSRQLTGYLLALRIENAKQPGLNIIISGADDTQVGMDVLDDGPDSQNALVNFPTPNAKATTAPTIEVQVADGGWETIAITEHEAGKSPQPQTTERGAFAFTHASEVNGGSLIYVATDYKATAWTLFAVDVKGKEHFCRNVWDNQIGTFATSKLDFDLPPDQIASFAVKIRPYSHRAVLKGFAARAGQAATPTVAVEKMPAK